MNMTANLLGLGNAATPLGIAAMKEMAKANRDSTTADNSMVMFVVLNTASIQLIPTSIGILRAKYGSTTPFDILPAVWVASVGSLLVGVIVAKLFETRKKAGKKDG
jgi:spore maturation protein A